MKDTSFGRMIWLNLAFFFKDRFSKEEAFSYKIPTFTDGDGRRHGKLWGQKPIYADECASNWFIQRDVEGFVKNFGGNIPESERLKMRFRQ